MPAFNTVKQTAINQPAFSESSLRYYIFHAETNGLAKAIRRVGRKILINDELFIEWINQQNSQGGV